MQNIFLQNVLYEIKFPFKIYGFEIESQNLTSRSLICKDDI